MGNELNPCLIDPPGLEEFEVKAKPISLCVPQWLGWVRKRGRLRIKTLAMVLTMILCANAGDLTLKRAMTEVGAIQFSVSGLTHAFWATLVNPTVWLGILFLIGFMMSYMTVLSWADYSYVMPSAAFGLVLLTFLAVIFLGETVTLQRWLGVLLICTGVYLVGQTKPRTTEGAR